MTNGDWRSASAYEYLRESGWHSYAWEFLRRNDDYRATYADPIRRAELDAGIGLRGQCWGIRFRG
ncbi:transcriptional regulator domain-containing protein [Methylocystis sp. IM2]|jgi:hypothetical protein|uniref:transcriptional regulator domain-containing protein n=1 Tax=unclassified Methylocystis TaxID=2625913 RepID=UPI00404832E8